MFGGGGAGGGVGGGAGGVGGAGAAGMPAGFRPDPALFDRDIRIRLNAQVGGIICICRYVKYLGVFYR